MMQGFSASVGAMRRVCSRAAQLRRFVPAAASQAPFTAPLSTVCRPQHFPHLPQQQQQQQQQQQHRHHPGHHHLFQSRSWRMLGPAALVGVACFATLGGGVALSQSAAEMYSPPAAPNRPRRFVILAAPGQEPFAKRLANKYPDRFQYFATTWGRFADNTDHIHVGGFHPVNHIRGAHVVFLASFHR